MGDNAISRIEIRNSGAEPIGPVTVRGGLNDDYVQIVRATNNRINAIVSIYSTPNNQTFGARTADAVLVHRYYLDKYRSDILNSVNLFGLH